MKNMQQYFTNHPFPVTIVAVFVLFITAWNAIRAYTAIANWDVLFGFDNKPAYVFASGLAWTIAGLVLYINLVKGKRLASRAGLTLSVLYAIWYWLDRLIIQASPAGNAEFSAVVSGVTLVIFNILLYWPSSQAFFTRRQDE
jgi:hypothetical protein